MSVSVVGAKLWNELDSNLRNTKTILLVFKKKKSNGVYYPRTYHMIEYLRVDGNKTLYRNVDLSIGHERTNGLA